MKEYVQVETEIIHIDGLDVITASPYNQEEEQNQQITTPEMPGN